MKTRIILFFFIMAFGLNILVLSVCGFFEWIVIKKAYEKQLDKGAVIELYKDGTEIVAVVNENAEHVKNVDISNKELDAYIDSIEDSERKALMKDYFLLPSVPQYTIQEIADLSLMERAAYLAEMPMDDLRAAVDVIKANIDNSIRLQNQAGN